MDFFKEKLRNQAIRCSPFLGTRFTRFFSSQLKNPIFIIGSARSGTTILAGLMGTHKDVANWSEANQIWDPNWYPWRPSHNGRWPMEYDPQKFIDQWWQEMESHQNELKAIFGAYQWLRRKPFFLNKSPFHTFRIPHLLKVFPQARFIHLIRDGRAVVHSYAKRLTERNKLQEWPEPYRTQLADSFEELSVWLASFWVKSIQEVDHQDQALKLRESGILLELTYEQLCKDPVASLNDLCNFLHLDPGRFGAFRKNHSVVNQNHKWRTGLEDATIVRISKMMEPTLFRKGYEATM